PSGLFLWERTFMLPDTEDPQNYPDQIAVVGVKVRDLGEVKKTRTDDHTIKIGDWVLLDMDAEQTYGKVYLPPQFLPFSPPMRVMRKVIRKATEEDQHQIARQQKLAREGEEFCLERIAALGLNMTLVEVFGSCAQRSLTFT